MASMEIDIRDEEPSVLVFSGSSTFELVLGSVSVTMTMEQFDKLCEQMRAWIVEDSPAHTSEARDAARYRFVLSKGKLPIRCSGGYYYEDGVMYPTANDAIDSAMSQGGGNG